MGLFNFNKKNECKSGGCCNSQPSKEIKTTCACGGSCGKSEMEKARFIVLGACCDKSRQTFENTKQAVKELGFADEVLNIGDAVEIAKYGVMQTPALVINNKVVSYGKMLKVEDVVKLIQKSGVK